MNSQLRPYLIKMLGTGKTSQNYERLLHQYIQYETFWLITWIVLFLLGLILVGYMVYKLKSGVYGATLSDITAMIMLYSVPSLISLLGIIYCISKVLAPEVSLIKSLLN